MSKIEEEHVEKLDVESLIVDLLACGLGAIIVLFFIFSVNMLSNPAATLKRTSKNATAANGTGLVALMGDDNPGKPERMGAIRIVEFTNVDKPAVEQIKKLWRNNKDSLFWEYRNQEWRKDSLFNSVETQLLVRENAVSFIFMADAIRKITFKTPAADGSNNITSGSKVTCRIYFVEGKSVKYDFNGVMTWPGPRGQEMESMFDRKIQILVGKASPNAINKLVRIIR